MIGFWEAYSIGAGFTLGAINAMLLAFFGLLVGFGIAKHFIEKE